jgi:hypothetical protein
MNYQGKWHLTCGNGSYGDEGTFLNDFERIRNAKPIISVTALDNECAPVFLG